MVTRLRACVFVLLASPSYADPHDAPLRSELAASIATGAVPSVSEGQFPYAASVAEVGVHGRLRLDESSVIDARASLFRTGVTGGGNPDTNPYPADPRALALGNMQLGIRRRLIARGELMFSAVLLLDLPTRVGTLADAGRPSQEYGPLVYSGLVGFRDPYVLHDGAVGGASSVVSYVARRVAFDAEGGVAVASSQTLTGARQIQADGFVGRIAATARTCSCAALSFEYRILAQRTGEVWHSARLGVLRDTTTETTWGFFAYAFLPTNTLMNEGIGVGVAVELTKPVGAR